MRRSVAKRLGLSVLGVIRSFQVKGVPPDVMGIGPAVAIPVAVRDAGKCKYVIFHGKLGYKSLLSFLA